MSIEPRQLTAEQLDSAENIIKYHLSKSNKPSINRVFQQLQSHVRWQARRIEELEAQLEMQRQTEVVRAIITMYEQKVIENDDVYRILMEYCDKYSAYDWKWKFKVYNIVREWAGSCELPDHKHHYINRIRAAIGMAPREEAGA